MIGLKGELVKGERVREVQVALTSPDGVPPYSELLAVLRTQSNWVKPRYRKGAVVTRSYPSLRAGKQGAAGELICTAHAAALHFVTYREEVAEPGKRRMFRRSILYGPFHERDAEVWSARASFELTGHTQVDLLANSLRQRMLGALEEAESDPEFRQARLLPPLSRYGEVLEEVRQRSILTGKGHFLYFHVQDQAYAWTVLEHVNRRKETSGIVLEGNRGFSSERPCLSLKGIYVTERSKAPFKSFQGLRRRLRYKLLEEEERRRDEAVQARRQRMADAAQIFGETEAREMVAWVRGGPLKNNRRYRAPWTPRKEDWEIPQLVPEHELKRGAILSAWLFPSSLNGHSLYAVLTAADIGTGAVPKPSRIEEITVWGFPPSTFPEERLFFEIEFTSDRAKSPAEARRLYRAFEKKLKEYQQFRGNNSTVPDPFDIKTMLAGPEA